MDVGIAEQEVIRRFGQGLGLADTVMHRPQLARPSVGKSRRRQHGYPVVRASGCGRMTSRGRGAVGAVVVDDDDRKAAAIILPQQRTDGPADDRGFITRRYDGNYARPRYVLRACRRARIVALRGPPEAAARRKQIDPDEAANRSD